LASIRPVFRIILGGLAIVLVYTVLVSILRPEVHATQHQMQDNVITAQRYIYSSSPHQVVVAGSSISTRLTALPPDYYNFALGGSSALTGLTIVLREGHHPPLVLIEANVLREIDRAFVGKLYNPFLYPLKRYVPSLRDEYHPLNVLMSWWLGKPGGSTIADAAKSQPQVPRQVLQVAIDGANAPIDDAFRSAVAGQLDEMERLVQAVEAGKSVPVFYWMPMHPEVAAASANQYQLRAFEEKFPHTRYDWISDLPSDRFQTTDGVHLGRSEALDYSRHFVAEVESIRKEISRSGPAVPVAPSSR
jgi:hypothetical protein